MAKEIHPCSYSSCVFFCLLRWYPKISTTLAPISSFGTRQKIKKSLGHIESGPILLSRRNVTITLPGFTNVRNDIQICTLFCWRLRTNYLNLNINTVNYNINHKIMHQSYGEIILRLELESIFLSVKWNNFYCFSLRWENIYRPTVPNISPSLIMHMQEKIQSGF